jgi:hypothetical protein
MLMADNARENAELFITNKLIMEKIIIVVNSVNIKCQET